MNKVNNTHILKEWIRGGNCFITIKQCALYKVIQVSGWLYANLTSIIYTNTCTIHISKNQIKIYREVVIQSVQRKK